MEEKILQTKKNGMTMLLLTLLGYVAAIIVFVLGGILLTAEHNVPGVILMVLGIVYGIVGIFLLCGLKVLKPEEALVLTLFGDYIGTLKGEGFYWVNPFCTSVNPAAGTVLSQSGDVQKMPVVQASREQDGKKISLKIMTLNNSRQKINDCLGNPVEIGIAVIWRVTDTAKAVFNVDNYKEYLSFSATAPCATSCGSTPTMWPPMWTPPVTASPTKAACAVRPRSWPSASRTRSRKM